MISSTDLMKELRVLIQNIFDMETLDVFFEPHATATYPYTILSLQHHDTHHFKVAFKIGVSLFGTQRHRLHLIDLSHRLTRGLESVRYLDRVTQQLPLCFHKGDEKQMHNAQNVQSITCFYDGLLTNPPQHAGH